jgi:hypothetical protein
VIGSRIWRRISAVAARFRTGSWPEAAAVRCMPAMVSATCAAAVGTAQPLMNAAVWMAARHGSMEW